MLQRVLDIPNIVDLKTDANREDGLFNWLLFLFPFYLKNAVRKGIYKTYIRRQYNDANVKGAIDVARHIKKNIPFLGKIAYNQREHSSDNYLLKLVRLTIDYIKGKPFGNSLLSTARDEIQLITGATPGYAYKDRRKIVDENRKHAVRHAFYHEYRSLQQLCLWILQDEKNLIRHGSQQICGILFDGAWLWEEYVNKLIGEYFYHPRNKANEGHQWLFSGEKSQAGKIFPDFIGKDAFSGVVADAKYKPSYNIGKNDNRDYYQVLAYMFRFKANKGFFLYPEAKDRAVDEELRLNEGSTYENNVKEREGKEKIVLKKLGLRIPKIEGKTFDEFVAKMGENEKAFCKVFEDEWPKNPSLAQS